MQYGLRIPGVSDSSGVNPQSFFKPPASPMDSGPPNPNTFGPSPYSGPRPVNVGGIMPIMSAGAVLEQRRQNDIELAQTQALPEVVGLAGYLSRCWEQARTAKQQPERAMLDALRARRGEYSPDELGRLRQQGGSAIYMMIMSTKARAAKALISDVVVGTGGEKGWTLAPTPLAELPSDVQDQILNGVAQEVYLAEQINGQPVDPAVIAQRLHEVKDEVLNALHQEAVKRTARMETKMEDQLIEGNYLKAMDDFIDDLTTYKTAFIQGPIIRRKPTLKWKPQPDGSQLAVVEQTLVKEWKRVDPLMIFPAPWSSNVNEAWIFQKHKLTRTGLGQMIGVPGYSEAAIRQVLDQYGAGLRKDWLNGESEKAHLEGKDQSSTQLSDTIDALQFHGSVSGKMLLDWGIDPAKCPDAAKEYECEVWMVGSYVIKATLNEDPLGRRGYYADSYESVPGAFWGNSLYDLIRDCIDMCNAAARSLANNLGISSGPQVGINVDRLPAGEQITQMYPWKIWQFTSDPMGNTTQPAMQFFQPQSNAQELMMVYEKFSTLADEYSGVPRYMTGTEGTPGAGRTASGLSMMIGNASKLIKDVISGIDLHITIPMLEFLYFMNMRFETDPDLKGDVQIKARGALSLVQKETASQARANFLATTMNPIDFGIMGVEGRSAVLHAQAKTLDLDPDKVVPTPEIQRRRAAMQQVLQAQMQGAGTPAAAQPAPAAGNPSGQTLMNGAPQTDNFSPLPAPAAGNGGMMG